MLWVPSPCSPEAPDPACHSFDKKKEKNKEKNVGQILYICIYAYERKNVYTTQMNRKKIGVKTGPCRQRVQRVRKS